MRYIIVVLLILVLLSTNCNADITFTNGKWETTFDCAEWGRQDGALTCDDMNAGLDCEDYSYLSGCEVGGCGTDCLSLEEEITTSANYPLGGGGRGMLHKLCGCPEATLSTSSSGGVRVLFSPARELWIRSYMKWGPNRTWIDSQGADMKVFYIYDDIGETQNIIAWHEGILGSAPQGGWSTQADWSRSPFEWEDVHGGGTKTGNNQWVYIEVHVKMDTDGTDGIYEVWIGDDHWTKTDVDYGNAASESGGWVEIRFLSNSHYVYGPTIVALDDLVIYNTTPPNVDADGNYFIGPIDYTPTYDPPTITGPNDFSTTSTSVEIEGPYSVDPDLADQSVIITWTLGASSGFAVAALGTFSCTVPIELGANSVVFRVVDSNDSEDSDTTVVTRTATQNGFIYTGSMSGGTYR